MFGERRHSRAAAKTIAPPLQLAWIGHTDALVYYFSSPIVIDGKVIIGVSDGEVHPTRAGVVCFDAGTGKRRWKTKTDADVHSSVAALDGQVYALSNAGKVLCLDTDSGNVTWTRKTHVPRFGWSLSLGPVGIGPDRVFVASDFTPLLCLDSKTGSERWRLEPQSSYYQTSSMGVFDNVGYTSQNVFYGAVDVKSGKFLWKKDIKKARGMSTPTRYGNVVYVPHFGILRAVYAESGDEIWQAPLDGPMTQSPGMAVAHNGRAFITHGDGIA